MVIDGKKIAEEMLAEVAEEVKKLAKPPRLAAILVEPNHLEAKLPSRFGPHLAVQPPSGVRKFLELKKKAAERVGIDFRLYEFPAEITTQRLRKEVVGIAKAGVNHGVLIELPLPTHINAQYVLNAVPQEKDVDVLSEKAQGTFFTNRSPILPPAVEAIRQIFKYLNIEILRKRCAIFGYGLLVGKPISHWLASQGATVIIINEFTANPAELSCQADIIISGVGKPNLIKADMIKDGAAVIDFGFSTQLETENWQLKTKKIVGDVDFEVVNKKAGWITPVPGGVGPIVIAAVLKNLVFLSSVD